MCSRTQDLVHKIVNARSSTFDAVEFIRGLQVHLSIFLIFCNYFSVKMLDNVTWNPPFLRLQNSKLRDYLSILT